MIKNNEPKKDIVFFQHPFWRIGCFSFILGLLCKIVGISNVSVFFFKIVGITIIIKLGLSFYEYISYKIDSKLTLFSFTCLLLGIVLFLFSCVVLFPIIGAIAFFLMFLGVIGFIIRIFMVLFIG